MNKTLTVNIAGSVFHIEENAFVKLDIYLKTIKANFPLEERDEILHDIELRIAELFLEELNFSKEVITLKDVERVIHIMGTPDDYNLQQEYDKSDQTNHVRAKKLFRDTQNKVLGGVLSGLGHYFNIDVIWLRIIFVILVLFFGTGVLLYILLWILIPAAKTTSQILEMQGQPINVNTIENSVKKNIDNFQQNLAQIDLDPIKNKAKKATKATGSVIAQTLGIIFIVVSCLGLIPLIILLFSALSLNNPEILDILDSQNLAIDIAGFTALSTILWAGFFIAALPLVGIFIIGLRLLYSNIKYVVLTLIILFILWIGSIIAFIIPVVNQQNHIVLEQFSTRYGYRVTNPGQDRVKTDYFLEQALGQTNNIIIEFKDPSYFTNLWSQEDQALANTQDQQTIKASMRISETFSQDMYIKALIHADDNMNKNIAWKDSFIVIDQQGQQLILSTAPTDDILQSTGKENLSLQYTLYLPQGKTIQITNSLKDLLNLPELQVDKKYTLNTQGELVEFN